VVPLGGGNLGGEGKGSSVPIDLFLRVSVAIFALVWWEAILHGKGKTCPLGYYVLAGAGGVLCVFFGWQHQDDLPFQFFVSVLGILFAWAVVQVGTRRAP
jgi:hypothetical protein